MNIKKIVSYSVRVLGVAALVVAASMWYLSNQTVTTSLGYMAAVPGVKLEEKASKVPGILEESAHRKKSIASFEIRVKNYEKTVNDLNSELEGERSKNVVANADIVKKNSEIRSLNESLISSKKTVAERDSIIENLKREIMNTKALLAQTGEVDALKEKVASLEKKLADQASALAEAEKKAKLLEMSEIVQVVETDAEGNKVVKKVVKTPYIPKGDIATVIDLNRDDAVLAINRGSGDGIKPDQKILLKDKQGRDISEIMITEVGADFAVGAINREFAIPETIEVGDALELAQPPAPEEKASEENAAEEKPKPKDESGEAPAAEETNA